MVREQTPQTYAKHISGYIRSPSTSILPSEQSLISSLQWCGTHDVLHVSNLFTEELQQESQYANPVGVPVSHCNNSACTCGGSCQCGNRYVPFIYISVGLLTPGLSGLPSCTCGQHGTDKPINQTSNSGCGSTSCTCTK